MVDQHVSRRGLLAGASAVPLLGSLPFTSRARATPTPSPPHALDGVGLVGGGEPLVAVVAPPGRPAPVPPMYVEAESGVLSGGRMERIDDQSASGGRYVGARVGGPSNQGQVDIRIDIPVAGTYSVDGLVRAQGPTADSFWFSIDDSDPVVWTFAEKNWTWHSVVDSDGAPIPYELTAGRHIVTVAVREPGAHVDQLRFSTPADQVADAITTVTRSVEISTGVALPVVRAEDEATAELPQGRLYVGWVGPAVNANRRTQILHAADGLDPDGYVLDAAASSIVILGASDWGTRFGAYELLERHVGVRWLLPGEDWEEIPAQTALSVPAGRLVDQPAFSTRTLTRLWDSYTPISPDWRSENPKARWAAQNRTHSQITRWGVEMWEIFTYAQYGDPASPDHDPDLYGIVDGVVRLPTNASDRRWQPRFSEPKTIQIAIDFVVQAWDRNPSRNQIALNINDTRAFSDTDSDGTTNRIGLPNCSEVYYDWINQVVAGAIAQRPAMASLPINVLAYENVVEPPSFDLHPSVIPWLCRDHYGYVDAEFAADNDAFTVAWELRATRIALYDYNYGTRYAIPRIHNDATARYLRFAHDHGARHVFADGLQNFGGEAAKQWIYLKLLWNPELDPDELLTDWCTAAVGPAAGPHLKQYMEILEGAWVEQVPGTGWFAESSKTSYFVLAHSSYLDGISSSDAGAARAALDQAQALADTPVRQQRADTIARFWDYPQATILSYPHPSPAPTTTREAIALVHRERDGLDDRVAQATSRTDLFETIRHDPLFDVDTDPGHLRYRWTGWDGTAFWHLVDFLGAATGSAQRSVRIALQQVGAHGRPHASRFADLVLRAADADVSNDVVDPSLEGTAGWSNSGPATRSATAARTGAQGQAVPATVRNTLYQEVSVTPGVVVTRMFCRSTSANATGAVSISLDAVTAAGTVVDRYQLMQRPVPTGGDWSWIAAMEDIPAVVGGEAITASTLGVVCAALDTDGEVHLDDAIVITEN